MATTWRIVYHWDDETIKKDKREFSLTDEIMELINSWWGWGWDAINWVKVNWQVVNPDQAWYVWLTIPWVINNLTSNSTTDALSAKQWKVLYEYIQALQHVWHFLALWNTATWLPVTNPETSPYTYNTWDYYIVSNVAAEGWTNYKPNGSSYTINVASTTVESWDVQVNDLYFYDWYERRLLDNSWWGSSIAVDSSLSTTSTNPVQNMVITNRLNQMALDANTKTFWLTNLQDTTTWQAIRDWVDGGWNAIVYYSWMPYYMTAKSATRITLYSKFTGTQNSPSNQSTGFTEQLMWIDNNNNTITITNTAVWLWAPYLATNQNYATVYTPLYDGSPATKKYVDDKFSAVPVYTAGNNIDITSNQISTIRNWYVYVTCNDAASTKAKTGTSAEGNYTPQEWDLVMVHFVNWCSVWWPTIAIDWWSAIPFYIWVDGANAGNMYFGSTNVSKMFIYTNGKLVWDAVKDNNNIYSAWTGLALSNWVFSNTQPWPTVSATAPANPSQWDMWYDTTNNVLKVYNGSSWDEAWWGEQECYTWWTDIEIVPWWRLHNLPTWYTELEYVTATWDQLITLNLTWDAVVDFKAQWVTPMDASNVLFDSSENWSVWYYYWWLTTDNWIWAYTTIPFYTDVTGHLSYVWNAVEWTVGSASVSRSRTTTITRWTWTLFWTMSQTTWYKFPFYWKLYYFKATQNWTVTYNLIPAKNSSNVAWLYDIVNDVFYTSSRTALTAWPVATEWCSVINYTWDTSNVKAFFLEDDEDTTTAQAAIDWANEWNLPLLVLDDETYTLINVENTWLRAVNDFEWEFGCDKDYLHYGISKPGYFEKSYITISTSRINDVDTVTRIEVDSVVTASVLTTWNSYQRFTPSLDYDPVTKKYVDDKMYSWTTAPSNPVEWQLWYDTTNDELKVYNWTTWNVTWGWIRLAANSPLTVTEIWAWTETQYNNLSSKWATTAYLCVEE